MAAPLEFMPVDIDMGDDPKVFALMEEAGGDDESARWAAYGRLVALMQKVYKDGFYLHYGRFERRKLARDLGLTGEEMDGFVQLCVDCEIFDRELYEGHGVLTSRGIQRRYFKAKKTGKAAVSDEDRPYLLVDSSNGTEPVRERNADKSSGSEGARPVRRTKPRNAEPCSENRRESPSLVPRIAEPSEDEDKRREDKGSKEKMKRREAPANPGAIAPGAPESSSSDSNEKFDSFLKATPLGCLKAVSDPAGAYFDGAGEAYGTPWSALASDYDRATHGQEIAPFARQVAKLCPPGCDRSLERVEACARMLQRAVRQFDPDKGANPYPLARKILLDERGDAA